MQELKKSVAIIGAGIAGIASAIRLANKGYKVTVYEANLYPGGKLSEFWQQDFRFDAGPSLFTLPHMVDELFTLSGKNPEDYFVYEKLAVTGKYFYEDGTVIIGYADKEKFEQEIHAKTGEKEFSVRKALENSRNLYDLLSDLFMHRSLHQWKTWFNKKALKAYVNLHNPTWLQNF